MFKEKEREIKHFGVHLTIDGYCGDFDKLNEREVVHKFLDELPDQLNMLKMHSPILVAAWPNDKKDSGGWTGVVTIAESHLSIHTFPARRFVSADVYTCQESLDKDYIIKYIKELFDLKEIEENFILRGKKFPSQNLSEPKLPSGIKPDDFIHKKEF